MTPHHAPSACQNTSSDHQHANSNLRSPTRKLQHPITNTQTSNNNVQPLTTNIQALITKNPGPDHQDPTFYHQYNLKITRIQSLVTNISKTRRTLLNAISAGPNRQETMVCERQARAQLQRLVGAEQAQRRAEQSRPCGKEPRRKEARARCRAL